MRQKLLYHLATLALGVVSFVGLIASLVCEFCNAIGDALEEAQAALEENPYL